MSIPSIQERQQYFMWAYAHQSFRNVVKSCRFLSAPPVRLSDQVWRTLYTGIVAMYARPFTNSYGATKLPAEMIVPKKRLKLHNAIMDSRNKEIAHVDASDYKADDPSLGNLNQVRVTFTKGEHILTVSSTSLAVSEIHQLSQQLLEKAEYHVDKFGRKHIEAAPLPPGDYKLNLDETIPHLFIPIPPPGRFTAPSTSSEKPSAT
jgi:hypothetical protein